MSPLARSVALLLLLLLLSSVSAASDLKTLLLALSRGTADCPRDASDCTTVTTGQGCTCTVMRSATDMYSDYMEGGVECLCPGTYCGGKACLVRPVLGEPCGPFKPCLEGLQCELSTLRCSNVPRALGQGCTNRLTPCQDGMYCHRRDTFAYFGECKPLLPLGAPCKSVFQGILVEPVCQSGLYCPTRNVSLSVCTKKLKAKQACIDQEESPCMEGTECRLLKNDGSGLGVCAHSPPWPGELCNWQNPCSNGYCENGVCQPGREWGAACTSSNQCGLAEKVCISNGEDQNCVFSCKSNQPCYYRMECDIVEKKCLRSPRVVGEPCGMFSKCETGAFCSGGTCKVRVGPGKACANMDECKEGLFCNLGACASQMRPGEACDPKVKFICSDEAQCDAVERRCVHTPRWPGERCDLGNPCVSGMKNSYCNKTNVCVPGIPAGGSCTASNQCGNAKKVCGALSGLGQNCVSSCITGTNSCRYIMECDPVTRECSHSPRELGEHCSALNPCAPGALYCDKNTNACVPTKKLGESCAASSQCGAAVKMCGPLSGLGQDCLFPCETGTQSCEYTMECDPFAKVCTHSPRELGENCGPVNACATGLYCSKRARSTCQTQMKSDAWCNFDYTEPGLCEKGYECTENWHCEKK